jgi:hypothetical protein
MLQKVALGNVLSLVSIITTWLHTLISFTDLLFFPHPTVQQPLVGQGLLIIEDSRSHSDAHTHSVGVLWTSGQAEEETSIWQHTTLTRDRHPRPRRVSNPQSYQASGRRPTPEAFADYRRYLILANDSAVK